MSNRPPSGRNRNSQRSFQCPSEELRAQFSYEEKSPSEASNREVTKSGLYRYVEESQKGSISRVSSSLKENISYQDRENVDIANQVNYLLSMPKE